ncbi:MAG: hypothetical protein RBT68_07375 [Spirochaetia bacterium]|nr:hypothetical protein [Spirochaetia bacterium]
MGSPGVSKFGPSQNKCTNRRYKEKKKYHFQVLHAFVLFTECEMNTSSISGQKEFAANTAKYVPSGDAAKNRIRKPRTPARQPVAYRPPLVLAAVLESDSTKIPANSRSPTRRLPGEGNWPGRMIQKKVSSRAIVRKKEAAVAKSDARSKNTTIPHTRRTSGIAFPDG